MNKFFPLIFLFVVLAIVSSTYFIVNESTQVVVTRFGKVVGQPISEAGVYFKLPLIDSANVFDKRILEWDGDMTHAIPTHDKKNIIVDTTARWRIVNPLKFMQTVAVEAAAQSRLDDIIDSNVRDVISRYDLIELVRNSNRVIDVLNQERASESFIVQDPEILSAQVTIGREKTMHEIFTKSKPVIEKYGIELVDVRIKGIMYSPSVLDTVYKSMISQYEIKAQTLRSEGDKKKSQIDGETELETKRIRSEAYKKSQTMRGEGDAIAARTYANAMSADPSFYKFYKSLESYENLKTENTTMVLSTSGDYFKMLSSVEN